VGGSPEQRPHYGDGQGRFGAWGAHPIAQVFSLQATLARVLLSALLLALIDLSVWKANSRKLRSKKYAGEVHGRTILNLASRSTLTPSLSPKSTISSVVLFDKMPPKLNVLEPVPAGPGFKVKRTASPRKRMPR
jgi:hypothetical protein